MRRTKKHEKRGKKLFSKLTATVSAAAMMFSLIPANVSADTADAAAVQCVGTSDFEDGIAKPWRVLTYSVADASYDVKDGSYNIKIFSHGNGERSDLQFRHEKIHLEEGHTYKVHWELESTEEGELDTYIDSLYDMTDDDFVYDSGDLIWRNNKDSFPEAWTVVKIEKGKNSFDSTFTAKKTIDDAVWGFEFARSWKYGQFGAFPTDTVLKFDNMSLECVTCGECTDSDKITCGWDKEDELGVVNPRSDVRLNQLGYYPYSVKRATYATSTEKESMDFQVLDEKGNEVYKGKTQPLGFDTEAEEYCQIIDFSEVTAQRKYTIRVDDAENTYTNKKSGRQYEKYVSHEFTIGNNIYKSVLSDTMNSLYQSRSGIDIEEKYITSCDDEKNKAKLAHKDFYWADEAYLQKEWHEPYGAYYQSSADKKTPIDVSGGWYTGEFMTKDIVAGANTVWLLQNMYEMSLKNGTADKWADGKTMNVPENETTGKAAPDVLDKARYELEFMFKMMVDPEKDSIWGDKYANFVYHNVENAYFYDYRDIYKNPEKLEKVRVVTPPTYAATFDMIACAAQAARLWKGIDKEFSEKCLANAKAAWESIMAYREKWDISAYDTRSRNDSAFTPERGLGSNDYCVRDEAYWAACELFATTGDKEYYDALSAYEGKNEEIDTDDAFGITSGFCATDFYQYSLNTFDEKNTADLGTLSLYLSDNVSAEDKLKISVNIKAAAKNIVDTAAKDTKNNYMEAPYKPYCGDFYIPYVMDFFIGYEYGSNAIMADNAVLLSYAYDATGDETFRNYAENALNYIFGRNALGISYVTGYGSYHVNDPVNYYWLNELNNSFPKAPNGVMVSGANGLISDYYSKSTLIEYNERGGTQKKYADSVEAYSVNAMAPQWQAALAWDMSFFEDNVKSEPSAATTTTTTTTTVTSVTTATTVSSEVLKPTKSGDANCDDSVDMGDVVLITQSLANPDKYGVGGSDKYALTEQGKVNADVDKSSKGITNNDALRIQEFLLHKAEDLSK